MAGLRFVLTLTFVARATMAGAQVLVSPELRSSEGGCDERVVHRQAETARFNIVAAVDGAEAIDAWRHVLANGGAVGWTATEYNVDARSTFVFAFDRTSLRVYRANAFRNTEDARHGCIDPAVPPEAVIPWENVREIEAGNWVLWFKLREPVEIRSDRGKQKKVKELKVFFHGASGDTLTYHYNLKYEGRIPFWNIPVYSVANLRGIAVGPTDFQRRMQFVIANAVDPEGRIALSAKAAARAGETPNSKLQTQKSTEWTDARDLIERVTWSGGRRRVVAARRASRADPSRRCGRELGVQHHV